MRLSGAAQLNLSAALLAGGGQYVPDVICAAALLIFTMVGAKKGAIASVIGLCSTVLSLAAAYYLAMPAANLLNEMFGVYQKFGENFWYVAGGIAVFVLCKLLLGIIARILTKIANSVKAVGAANTLLGAAVGFLKAGILILAVLAVLSVLPETLSFVPKAQAAIDKTFFVHTLRDNNPLLTWLLKVIDRAKEGIGTETAWLLP